VYPELLVRASNLLEILIAVSPITRSVASRLPTIPGPRRSLGRAVASTHVFPNGRNVGYCHNPAVSDVYRNVWRLDRTNPHFGKLMVWWLHCYPPPELLSFLKQTHDPWTKWELSKALNIGSAEAKQAVAAMQLQGYVGPSVEHRNGGLRRKG
jgi:hypothetical protein